MPDSSTVWECVMTYFRQEGRMKVLKVLQAPKTPLSCSNIKGVRRQRICQVEHIQRYECASLLAT